MEMVRRILCFFRIAIRFIDFAMWSVVLRDYSARTKHGEGHVTQICIQISIIAH